MVLAAPSAPLRLSAPVPRLGPRLNAVARRVLPGEALADIGADHARLTLALVACEAVPWAIAVDRLSAPLAVARRAAERCGLSERIDVRRGDGLAPIAPGEVATVVIAGMGGAAIRRILERQDPAALGVRRLVLQPQTEQVMLYDWLDERWGVAGTVVAAEHGRRYVIGWVDVH
jgi:tRNA (adenine22-N1)-methyltransferase